MTGLEHESRAGSTPAETPSDPVDDRRAPAASREHRIGRAFVSLADTMVDEFDLAEFLHMLVDHCVDLLEVDAAGGEGQSPALPSPEPVTLPTVPGIPPGGV